MKPSQTRCASSFVSGSPSIYESVGGVNRKNDLPPVRDTEDSQGRPDEDDLVVGEGDGTLANEAKSPVLPINMKVGVILFLPKNEPYKLRNVGKQDLHITVIRMRPTTPASR